MCVDEASALYGVLVFEDVFIRHDGFWTIFLEKVRWENTTGYFKAKILSNTLQISQQIFPEIKLRGLSPNS